MVLDVTDEQNIKDIIKSVLKKESKIDIFFNNAGFGQPGAIEDISTKALKEQFETNVFALHECTVQVLPVMLKQGYGKIIQHSSVLGIVSLFGRGAYNASKYAVEGLTDTLRLELQGSGVSVTLLNTGPIRSDFRKNALKKLKRNVNIESSRFDSMYERSLSGKAKKVPFEEDAVSVAKVVYKIALSKRVKPRYYITKATYLLGFAKRVLSTTMLDRLLKRIG